MKIINETMNIKNETLHIFVKEPFPGAYKMNYYYLKFCFLLEEGTNSIILKNRVNKTTALTAEMLIKYLGLRRQAGYRVLFLMRKYGMLLKVCVFQNSMFYINPRFAFNGNEIPKFLLDMFDYNFRNLYDKYKINLKGIDEK